MEVYIYNIMLFVVDNFWGICGIAFTIGLILYIVIEVRKEREYRERQKLHVAFENRCKEWHKQWLSEHDEANCVLIMKFDNDVYFYINEQAEQFYWVYTQTMTFSHLSFTDFIDYQIYDESESRYEKYQKQEGFYFAGLHNDDLIDTKTYTSAVSYKEEQYRIVMVINNMSSPTFTMTVNSNDNAAHIIAILKIVLENKQRQKDEQRKKLMELEQKQQCEALDTHTEQPSKPHEQQGRNSFSQCTNDVSANNVIKMIKENMAKQAMEKAKWKALQREFSNKDKEDAS